MTEETPFRTAQPSWYSPDGDDGDLILSATIDCGPSWGKFKIADPPESMRRRVQTVQLDVAKTLGFKPGQKTVEVIDSKVLDAQAKLHAAKLAAYVVDFDCEAGKLTDEPSWTEALKVIPGKVVDRLIHGIDIFSGAEGNEQPVLSAKSVGTSSSAGKHQKTGDTSGSCSTSSTQAEPGSSPEAEVFANSLRD